MGVDLVIVARTDALSATFLDSNIDPVDHPFILGVVDASKPQELMTYPEIGFQMIDQLFKGEQHEKVKAQWESKCYQMSLSEALIFANKLGFTFQIDWEAARTDEGFYKVKGSVEYCVRRGLIFSEYADLLWMETPTPSLAVAKNFSDRIHQYKPNVMLAYNLSPSFNWEKENMTNDDLEAFTSNLAQLGYAWQFITLAGFHMSALISEVFTRNFAKHGMLSYVT